MNKIEDLEVVVKKKMVYDIPLYLIYNKTNKCKPIIFLFHKLLEDKSKELPLGLKLAENGYCVVLIDMHGHGERSNSFYIKKKYDFNLIYRDIYNTAKDISSVIKYLKDTMNDELDFNNIGSVGVSIGASVALVSGFFIDEIKFVVGMIGSYDWKKQVLNDAFRSFKPFALYPEVIEYEKVKNDIEKYEPFNKIMKDNEIPILFQHGALDFSIPVNIAREYYRKIKEVYERDNKGDYLCFLMYDMAGHQVTNDMEIDLIKWLKENTNK